MADDSPKIWTTSDMAFAAYAKMRSQMDRSLGVQFVGASRRHSGRYEFRFEDPNGACDKLTDDFAVSESQRFDSEVTTLRKLVASKK